MNIGSLHRNYCKLLNLLQDKIGNSAHFLPFYANDIPNYHGLEKELSILDNIFTAHFGIGNYRNLLEVITLACFLKTNSIIVNRTPVQRQLNFNSIINDNSIHHDSELTPVILCQLSYPTKFSFGNKNYGEDLSYNNIAIEIGDTRVSKVWEHLENKEQAWIIPILRKNKHKYLEHIFIFTRGPNWNNVNLWNELEEKRHEEEGKIISEIFER